MQLTESSLWFGFVRNVCLQRKKISRPKALESMDKKLDALLESSQQHQDSLIDTETKVDNATQASTLATESIIKSINCEAYLNHARNISPKKRSPSEALTRKA